MTESFASLWLSRAALVAFVIYLSCAARLWRLSPGDVANRLAAALCLDLGAWALQAAVSYAANDPGTTIAMTRALSWSWPFFPAIGLHLAVDLFDADRKLNRVLKRLALGLVYATAALLYYLLSWPLLEGAVMRAGYWSVDIREGAGLAFFSFFYLAVNLAGMGFMIANWARSRTRQEKSKFRILVLSHALALAGGFTTDTVLAALGVDFPKVGVLWACVWAAGLMAAMGSYGFLSPFSSRELDLLLERFVERSMDGIAITDPSGFVMVWNEPMAAMSGIPKADALGKPIVDIERALALPADFPEGAAAVPVPEDAKKAPGLIIEFEIRRPDGTRRFAQASIFSIPSSRGRIWASIARDVTREKEANRLALDAVRRQGHAQKMEAIGSLAGGIAHDFNNTLGGIVGAVSLIRAGMDDDGMIDSRDFARELDIIASSSQRAASSVRGLMSFAANKPPRNEAFRLDEAAARVVDFASRLVSRAVTVRMAPGAPAATVTGDAPQIEQLVLNLVINAEHAMTIMKPAGAERGGAVDVAVSRVAPDAAFRAAHPEAAAEGYWLLTVADSGVGMAPDVLARAFDPFYTTKGSDAGSGMGLYMADSIASQHGGFIEVESEPGKGTTFYVYLPDSGR